MRFAISYFAQAEVGRFTRVVGRLGRVRSSRCCLRRLIVRGWGLGRCLMPD